MSDTDARPGGDARAEACLQLEFELTDELVLRANRRCRRGHRGLTLPLLRIVVVLLCLAAMALLVADRKTTLWLAGFGALMTALVVAGWAVHWKQVREGRRLLAAFPHRRFTYRLTDRALRIADALSSSETQWVAFNKLERFPDVYLLYPRGSKAGIIFPVTGFNGDALVFLEDKVRSVGGKVK